MWIDQEVFVADSDYKIFADAGFDDQRIKAEVAKLSTRYVTPLTYNQGFDLAEYVAGLDKAKDAESEEQSTPETDKDGDPASDSGAKHSAPEGKDSTDESGKDTTPAEPTGSKDMSKTSN